jgi:hypothetical protein
MSPINDGMMNIITLPMKTASNTLGMIIVNRLLMLLNQRGVLILIKKQMIVMKK